MREVVETLATSEGAMDVHGFVPGGADRGLVAGVIVLQEAFGVNAHVKRVCRRIAGLGYAAFAPELYHRSGRGVVFGYDEFAKARPILGALTNERILEDLRAAHGHVGRLQYVDPGRMAAWGFCMGGWAAVLAACEMPLAAAVSFYGGGLVRPRKDIAFTPLMDRLQNAGCPLLLVFGGQDPSITPADIEAVHSRLAQCGKPHEVDVYPEGGHGFFCEDRAAYHRPTAEAAWARAAAWLAGRLS